MQTEMFLLTCLICGQVRLGYGPDQACRCGIMASDRDEL